MSETPREESPLANLPVLGLTPSAVVDAGGLGADALLLRTQVGLSRLPEGEVLEVRSSWIGAEGELVPWASISGHTVITIADAGDHTRFLIRAGGSRYREHADSDLRVPPRSASGIDVRDWHVGRLGDIPDDAPEYLGFVPRGAVAEETSLLPSYPFTLNSRIDVWAGGVGDLYEQAKTQQWNATTDIRWSELPPLAEPLERAVCQLMTFLAENEYAALYIPSRFLPRINAQFSEVVLFLASIINDEARHIEAFTKRAVANGGALQYSSALTAWSLHSLLVQEDYFKSTFLLHVLGEGTFLDLLDFIERYAPDPVTKEVVRRSRLDEGRHVAYGIAHVRDVLANEPARIDDLVNAAEERAAVLQATSGSNPLVLEALAILAGGGDEPARFGAGLDRARGLYREMDEARVRRMLQIGLPQAAAIKISALHSPNFM